MTIFLVSLVAVVLVFAGLKKQPGLGIITAVIIIAIQLIVQKRPLSEIGFSAPENWIQTILVGMGLGVIIQIFSVILIEPLTEKITGDKHDHSILDAVRGNWKVYLQW
ncbi:MAG TPA: hypothetical protein VK856_12005, partial [Anaerolineaceae bacterium]|nr:hypothetical protein [Anaerolineaceae bacterium]